MSHLICVVYRSSEHLFTHWFDAFNEQLTNAYIDCSNITVMGDFNVDLLKKSDESKSSWLNITENFQFCQLIDEPTRVTNTTRTLINHIFTTVPTKVRCTKVPIIGLSDHFPTIIVYKDSFGTKSMQTTIKF